MTIKAFSLKPKSGALPKQLFILLHGMGQTGEHMIDHFSKALADRFPDAEILAPQGFENYAPEKRGSRADPAATPDADMPNMPGDRQDRDLTHLRQWFSLAVNSPDIVKKSKKILKVFNRAVLWFRMMGAEEQVNRFIDEALIERGLSDKNLVIMGFSQGGSLALYTALRRDKECAALVCHSGIFHGSVPVTSKPPTLLIHGNMDKVVLPEVADRAQTILRKYGVPVRLEIIEGLGHRTNGQAARIYTDFIEKQLKKTHDKAPRKSRKKGRWIKSALKIKRLITE